MPIRTSVAVPTGGNACVINREGSSVTYQTQSTGGNTGGNAWVINREGSSVTYASGSTVGNAPVTVVTAGNTDFIIAGSGVTYASGSIVGIALDQNAFRSTIGGCAGLISGWTGTLRSELKHSRQLAIPILVHSSQTNASPKEVDHSSVSKYSAIYRAIEHMRGLDYDDGMFIDDEAARSASLFVSLLSLYNVPAPQLFAHGGDTVVLKWIRERSSTLYVTLIENGIVSLHRHVDGKPLAAPIQYNTTREEELVPLIADLGGSAWRAVRAS